MFDSSASPTFSLIIPCFNVCEGLARTLTSLKQQGVVSLEIVVIDGCSTDGTAAYLADASPKIHLPILIAHFDTPGLSAGGDTTFQSQRLALLRRYLGWDVFLLSWLGAKMPRGIRHALWLPLYRLGLLRHAAPAAKSSADAPLP